MGRPKKYSTPEERVLAARSYRTKYYSKNREFINQKLSDKRKKRKVRALSSDSQKNCSPQVIGEASSRNTMLPRRAGRPRGARAYHSSVKYQTQKTEVAEPQDSVNDIKSAFRAIIGESSRKRLEFLCKQFIASNDYREIDDTHSLVEKLNQRLCTLTPYSWMHPPPPEITLSKAICSVIKALEDLLMNAMEGIDISDLERRGMLVFQTAPDVTLFKPVVE